MDFTQRLEDAEINAMRHTSQINLEIGGAVFITYDSEKEDFEENLGDILLDAGGIQ